MSDKEFVINLEDDAEGHATAQGIVEADDTEWLEQKLRSDSGTKRVRLLPDDREDTEGHASDILVRAMLEDEDETEGHAIAIHFPSRADADAFRRRLLVTGVLVGTVALGAAGGVGLSALQSDDGGAAAQAQANSNFQAAAAAEGERQGAAAAQQAQADSNFQAAAAAEGERQGAASAASAAASSNYQEAAANEAARQGSAENAADDSSEVRTTGGPTPR